MNNKNFWKADSKTPNHSTYTPKLCRYHQFYNYKNIIWNNAKWLLALLVVTGIVGIIVYILEVESNLNAETTNGDYDGHFLSNLNDDKNSSTFEIDQLHRGEKIVLSSINYNGINQTHGHYTNNNVKNRSPLPASSPPLSVGGAPNDSGLNGSSGKQRVLVRGTTVAATMATSTSTPRPIKETDFNANSNNHNNDWKDRVVHVLPQKVTPAPNVSPAYAPKYSVTITSTVTTKQQKPQQPTNGNGRNAITILSTGGNSNRNANRNVDGNGNGGSVEHIAGQDRPKIMYPSKETLKNFGFTSGHQNNFGIPIEEDERILRMLNAQLVEQNGQDSEFVSTTDLNSYRTKVSPTLPILRKLDSTTEAVRLKTINEGKNLHIFLGDYSYESYVRQPIIKPLLHD